MTIPIPTFDPTWEQIHQSRAWGRYPSEDVIRFVARAFRGSDPSAVRLLDLGCGNGANSWFLRRERYQVHGIDGSSTALRRAVAYLQADGAVPPLCQGDAGLLPYAGGSFDGVIDSGVICSNTTTGIRSILAACFRVLRPGGLLFSSGLFTPETTGYGTGDHLEHHTFQNLPLGPLAALGTIHFFDRQEIETLWQESGFTIDELDQLTRTYGNGVNRVAYWLVVARKAL